ncbi:Hpt domain-containing protein [Benzoatithermus flavus]|uniref:Hpt domain-containing protein n=1 Tax=Benzoatithermus flavus TaxID=3108223 RepID=A0ABU8XT51_9PROT
MVSQDPPHGAISVPADEVLDRAVVDVLYDDLGTEVVNGILLTAVADIERHGTKLLGLTDAEPEAIRRSAHVLAGVSAAIGAVELTALARQMERTCAVDHGREALQAALRRITSELTAVVTAHG